MERMNYEPPKPGQEVTPFETSGAGNMQRASFDQISSVGPYQISDEPNPKTEYVSQVGVHRYSTQVEDTLIIRGSTYHSGTATILSSVLNLANTILGAGLLGLPYAVSKSGYILGIILFVLFACLSSVGLNLIMASARLVPDASFYTLSQRTIPKLKRLGMCMMMIQL